MRSHKTSLVTVNEKLGISQKQSVMEEKQGHIQESVVKFYEVQLMGADLFASDSLWIIAYKTFTFGKVCVV
jgi:hypothetical protein